VPAAAPAATPATNGAAPVAGHEWLTGADEAMSGYVQNKAWKSPTEVITSYQNLEKLLGADRAGNTVVLPKSDAAPEEWNAVFDRLGRPADASGYKFEVPEQIGDPEFAKAASSKFHELGLSQKQGEALATWWNETAKSQYAAVETAAQQRFETENAKLQTEWGAAYAQNLTLAQAAVRALGVDGKTIDTLASAMGHKATMELFHKIGAKTGEADFVSGQGGFGSALTPAAAKDQIRTLMTDKTFSAKYINGDAEAKAKMAELHKYAYPEE
jgi:hypothetical protein